MNLIANKPTTDLKTDSNSSEYLKKSSSKQYTDAFWQTRNNLNKKKQIKNKT